MSSAATPTPAGNTANLILIMLQAALTGLSAIPAIGGDIAIAGAFVNIIQAGLNAFHAASGAPLDLTKIPLEQPVP